VPLYEYQCPKCGRFELIRKFSDEALSDCPTCGRKIQKLLSAPAIQFKGSGWYVTDYARKSSGGDSSKAEGGKGGDGAKAGEGASKGDTSASSTTPSKDGSASSSKEAAPASKPSGNTAK
jgi:putative FmdB family regulatory protein